MKVDPNKVRRISFTAGTLKKMLAQVPDETIVLVYTSEGTTEVVSESSFDREWIGADPLPEKLEAEKPYWLSTYLLSDFEDESR